MDERSDPIRPEELDGLFAPLVAHLPCALAVSGGSDSTALMVLFADWLRQTGREPARHAVVSIDHGLRRESRDETWQVREWAMSLGYRCDTLIMLWDPNETRTGVQAAARERRYRLIGSYMRRHGIPLLLTGHTRDDQAETLLMRLARGSGLDGLSAMAPLAPLADGLGGIEAGGGHLIARPLLDVPKTRLRATLRARGIAWIEDPSNAALKFERSRLRAARAALDALGLTDAMLALSAKRLLRARRALQDMVEQFCDADAGAVGIDACGIIAIERERLRRAEEEIALRVLHAAIVAAGGAGEPVPLGRLETIAAAICGGTVAVPARWTLARALITAERATVTMEREPGRKPLPDLTVAPGTSVLWDGRFRVSVGSSFDGPVQVQALGAAALRHLRRRGAVAARLPSRAAAMVPSVWREGELIAVPSLRYWKAAHGSDAIGATFIGIAKPNLGSR